MATPPLLLMDASFLAHRAFNTPGTARLQHNGKPTGATWGFLRDVRSLLNKYDTPHAAFFFEFGIGRRQVDHPGYKGTRGVRDPVFDQQLRDLATVHLPACGFNNIYMQDGFEADDLIAEFCAGADEVDGKLVIVSADKDLYQCLSKNVSQYNPVTKKAMTWHLFEREYGIPVEKWVEVKATAGCKTDDIIGVPGVGELTAIKYIRGKLERKTEAYQKINYFVKKMQAFKDNCELVELPYKDGVDLISSELEYVDNTVTDAKWNAVLASIGAKPLGYAPATKRPTLR